MKVRMGFFKCMDSMARDMRHPYIPSTTVLGDIVVSELRVAFLLVTQMTFMTIVLITRPQLFLYTGGLCHTHFL